MAEAQNITTAAGEVEAFMIGLKAAAKAQAEKDKAAAEASQKAWQDLYASIPEGRLRTMTESVGIKAALDDAQMKVTDATAKVNRFAEGPMLPA